jgi:hypothetical protein
VCVRDSLWFELKHGPFQTWQDMNVSAIYCFDLPVTFEVTDALDLPEEGIEIEDSQKKSHPHPSNEPHSKRLKK